jgi:thiol-disulfide isomerase/thioredoxin
LYHGENPFDNRGYNPAMETEQSSRLTFRQMAVRAGIVFSVLLIASCAPQSAEESADMLGKPAPDFSLTSIDNQQVKLSDLKGKVVVLDFWATWCPPCRESLPKLNQLSADTGLGGRGLKVLAINAQESAPDVNGFIRSNHYTLPVLLDPDGSVERAYGADSLPTTIVVGRDGTVKYAIAGIDPRGDETPLNDAIEKALAEGGK